MIGNVTLSALRRVKMVCAFVFVFFVFVVLFIVFFVLFVFLVVTGSPESSKSGSVKKRKGVWLKVFLFLLL